MELSPISLTISVYHFHDSSIWVSIWDRCFNYTTVYTSGLQPWSSGPTVLYVLKSRCFPAPTHRRTHASTSFEHHWSKPLFHNLCGYQICVSNMLVGFCSTTATQHNPLTLNMSQHGERPHWATSCCSTLERQKTSPADVMACHKTAQWCSAGFKGLCS